MKQCYFFIVLFFFAQFSFGQEIHAKNGWYLAPYDTIRVLVVFIEVDYDENPKLETYQAWGKGKLPESAPQMFDAFASNNPQGKITRFFHESSFGNYHVLGDYLPNIITVKKSEANGRLTKYTLQKVASEYLTEHLDFTTKNGLSYNDFDFWDKNQTQGGIKENKPNGQIDHLMLIIRNFHGLDLSRGYASPNSFGKIGNKNTDTYSVFAGPDFQIMRHEYAHLLFGGNNFHCGGGQHNGGGENYFIPLQGGWSTMGNYNSMFMTCNAWDRDRFDWRLPGKSYNISALSSFTKMEVNTDLDGSPREEILKLTLRDFVQTGDAVRIKLPFIPENEYQQWIWIENHQTETFNGSPFDQFQYADQECKPKAQPGVYMYLQVDKNKKEGREAFSGYGDFLRVIPANGFYEVFWEEGTQRTYCANAFDTHPFYKLPLFENPLTGTSDVEYSVSDKDRDKQITRGETDIKWLENRNGEYVGDLPHMGLPAHAFTPAGNNQLNLGTNPSTASMTTLVSLDYDRKKGAPPNNRSVFINGIDVKVLSQNEDGSIDIQVSFNNTKLAENQRWCGDTIKINSIKKDQPSLVVTSKTQLILDRGLTPTRISEPEKYLNSNVFTSPTQLVVKENVQMQLEKNADLILSNGSKLILRSGASLLLDKKATLKLDRSSRLVIENGAKIIAHKKSKIRLKPQQVIGGFKVEVL